MFVPRLLPVFFLFKLKVIFWKWIIAGWFLLIDYRIRFLLNRLSPLQSRFFQLFWKSHSHQLMSSVLLDCFVLTFEIGHFICLSLLMFYSIVLFWHLKYFISFHLSQLADVFSQLRQLLPSKLRQTYSSNKLKLFIFKWNVQHLSEILNNLLFIS